MGALRAAAPIISALLVLVFVSLLDAQGTPPPTPLMLISREGRRPVPTTILSGQELIALDDVASLFQVTVREDTLAGGITLTYKGRTIVVSADQPMASVNGRVVTLPSPASRAGRRWLVPVEFLSRALAPIYDTRIDLRRTSRLLIVGDLRVPRVVGRIDVPGPPTRATLEITPAAPVTLTVDATRVIVRVDADALDLTLPSAGGGLIDQIRPGDQPNTITVVLNGRAGMARAAVDGRRQRDAGDRLKCRRSTRPPETAAPPPPAPLARGRAGVASLSRQTRAALQTIVHRPRARRRRRRGARGERRGGEADHPRGRATASRPDRKPPGHPRGADARGRPGRQPRRTGGVCQQQQGRPLSQPSRQCGARSPASQARRSFTRGSIARAKTRSARPTRGSRCRCSAAAAGRSTSSGGTWRRLATSTASEMFAGMLEEDLRAHVTMGPRPLQEGPLRVLMGADMPAALVEMAYLTNPDEEQARKTEAFQNSLTQGIYDAVLRFRVVSGGARAR